MRPLLDSGLSRARRLLGELNTGQKAISLIGVAALLLGAFMVLKWASAPSYAPLFSGLSSQDASAIVDQLDQQGVPYTLADGGSTVMVPREQVYKTRIDLSGEGLPASSGGAEGYSILDNQGLSTSEFQQQTDFKRAMEGELANTVEALDGVNTAVVHLAIPEKQPFGTEQTPTTASVLVATSPGTSLGTEQVQAIVHLVASSVDGLDPANVTVADATGRVLTAPDGQGGLDSTVRDQQVEAVQNDLQQRLQVMLDRVVGAGNSTVQVTANLDFDKTVTETTDYQQDQDQPTLSESTSKEVYDGGTLGATAGVGGVVGQDGQTDGTGTTGGTGSGYTQKSTTLDHAIDTTVQRIETTPGAIKDLHIGVMLDQATTKAVSATDIQNQIAAIAGIDPRRGDTIDVTQIPFDRSAEAANAAELKAAEAAASGAQQQDLIRNGVLVGLVLVGSFIYFLRSRRHTQQRQEATSYVVEQLRAEQTRVAALEAAVPALAAAELTEEEQLRQELDRLVEQQPEDVAALLRGWLTER